MEGQGRMAKKFRFRLEKVLELRRGEADQARASFGEAEYARRKKEEEIEEMQVYYRQLLTADRQGKTSVQSLESQWYHARAVQSEIAALEHQRAQLVEIEEVKRAELAEAMKKQKILEKLKENKQEAHLREVDREEQNFMDEIAQQTGRSRI